MSGETGRISSARPARGPRAARRVLGWVAAGCAVWLLGLVATPVSAHAADPDRGVCGSLRWVLHTHSGYEGGEIRSDQDAFDRRCVDEAHERLWTALAPGAGLVGSSLALVLVRTRRRSQVGVVQPFR